MEYEGRLGARLDPAVRLVVFKADGSVAIHSDAKAYKPLNWMNPPCTVEERDGVMTVATPKGERLVIELHEVLFDERFELGVDPGLAKDGVEAELQQLIAARVEALREGLRLVRREYPTDLGPVDLLCRDAEGNADQELPGLEVVDRDREAVEQGGADHPEEDAEGHRRGDQLRHDRPGVPGVWHRGELGDHDGSEEWRRERAAEGTGDAGRRRHEAGLFVAGPTARRDPRGQTPAHRDEAERRAEARPGHQRDGGDPEPRRRHPVMDDARLDDGHAPRDVLLRVPPPA